VCVCVWCVWGVCGVCVCGVCVCVCVCVVVYVCSLSYPARNAHAPCYIAVCGLSVSAIFSTLNHKRHDFWLNVIKHKCVFFWNISHSNNNWAPYFHKCTLLLLDFSETSNILEKVWKKISNFMKILPHGTQSFNADGQTNRRDEDNRLFFLQFYESA